MAYRVDMRLRPEGDEGPLARSLAATLGYYQTSGGPGSGRRSSSAGRSPATSTWAATSSQAITPFVYRPLPQRRRDRRDQGDEAPDRAADDVSAGTAEVEVKTGHGGIRDVEFVVQFLQLLHGGEYPEVRHANTLVALTRLEGVGCLTAEERGIMVDTYRFLRRVEHRLQTMFDRQTHEMPRDREEQRTLAIRLGYPPARAPGRTGPARPSGSWPTTGPRPS